MLRQSFAPAPVALFWDHVSAAPRHTRSARPADR